MKKHKRKIFASFFGLLMLAGIATSASLASTSNNNANTTLVANTQSQTSSNEGTFKSTDSTDLSQLVNSSTEIDWTNKESSSGVHFDGELAYTDSSKTVLLGMNPYAGETSVTIPASVVEIRGYTLVNGSGENTTKQKVGAFEGNSDLMDVTILGTNVVIGNNAFKNCLSLTTVDIQNEGVKTIGTSAFENCHSLEDIKLPSTLTTIGSSAFKHTESLQTLEFPSSLTKIGKSAFEGSGLTSLDLSNTKVKTISENAFKGCSSLSGDVRLSNSTLTIGDSAFEGSAIRTLNINSALTSLGVASFRNCYDFTSFNVSNRRARVTVLPSSVFEGCYNLERVNLGAGSALRAIGSSALKSTKIKCFDLTATQTIYDSAFENCTNMKYLINANVLSFIGNNAFKNSALSEVTPRRYRSNDGNVNLQQVIKIGSNAFYGTNISTIQTGRNLTTIEDGAFKEILKLTKADFTKSSSLVKNTNAFDVEDQDKVEWPSSSKNIFRNWF